MVSKLRKLKVDLDEIAQPLSHDDLMMVFSCFLDLDTGEVVTVSEEARSIVDGLYRKHANFDDDDPLDLAPLLAESDYPEWQHKMVLLADQVEAEYGKRFVALPEPDSRAGYKDMEAFISTVDDQQFQAQLQQAIEGRSPFRRFKDVLSSDRRTR